MVAATAASATHANSVLDCLIGNFILGVLLCFRMAPVASRSQVRSWVSVEGLTALPLWFQTLPFADVPKGCQWDSERGTMLFAARRHGATPGEAALFGRLGPVKLAASSGRCNLGNLLCLKAAGRLKLPSRIGVDSSGRRAG